MLDADLRQTLSMTADAMARARDPWWVISSAAVALHGATPIAVGDVDVLTSVADARRVMRALGVVPVEDGRNALFRSTVFGRWKAAPLVVEIMAEFRVATAAGWTALMPRTRVRIAVEERDVFVPEREELAAMLRMFGRPKDLERARLLGAQV